MPADGTEFAGAGRPQTGISAAPSGVSNGGTAVQQYYAPVRGAGADVIPAAVETDGETGRGDLLAVR